MHSDLRFRSLAWRFGSLVKTIIFAHGVVSCNSSKVSVHSGKKAYARNALFIQILVRIFANHKLQLQNIVCNEFVHFAFVR